MPNDRAETNRVVVPLARRATSVTFGMRRIRMSARSRLLAVYVLSAVLVMLPVSALAHPSDFETLTLDVLIGPEGLEAIDAAVVESSGPSYEPGPTVELREGVAREVLDALDLVTSPVDIDLENSERYHWVGFTIRFHDPTLGGRSTLELDTRALQDVADDIGLKHLKLSVCHTSSSSWDPRDGLQVMPRDVSPPEAARCRGWNLDPAGEPVSITITVTGWMMAAAPVQELPLTGLDIPRTTWLAFLLLAAGLTLVALSAHLRPTGESTRSSL